ncbi:MAG: M16 family metallopeptidase [Acidimicrobiales bacterium]
MRSAGGDAGGIRSTRLPSGIQIVTERMPDAHSVTIGFWVDAGSRDEDPSISGASHFLEHLLFKGTETRSAREIAEAVEAVGGEMNAFTTKEYTAFYTRLLDTDLELGLDILSDIMWAPSFRPEEVEAERQVILEEILMHADEPSDLVHDLFVEALYPGHPLGREVLGEEATIQAISRDEIRGYFAEHYRPDNIVVAAAGNLVHDEVVDGIGRRLAWSEPAPGAGRALGPGTVAGRRSPVSAPRRLTVMHRPTEQAHLVVGMPAMSRDDPDRHALDVVNQVLGGGMSSRLFQEVRERRGLAYSVYSYRSSFIESGSLAVYVGTAPSRVAEVLDVVDAELARLVEGRITDHELAVAKGHLKGSIALGLEDSGSRMSRIGRSQLVHGEVPSFEELVARTEAVTPEDTARVVKRVLEAERVLAVIGPFEESAFADRVA